MSERITGYRHFEVFEFEDGSKHDIKVNSKSGEYLCKIDSEWIKDKDLQTIRQKIKEYLQKTQGLDWRAVINVSKPGWSGSELMPVDFERIFVATMKDGEVTYKKFQTKQPKDGDGWVDEDLCRDGVPGDNAYVHDTDSHIISYTFEKWNALNRIKEQFNLLRDKIEEILLSKDLELVLEQVNNAPNIFPQIGFFESKDKPKPED